MVYSKRTSTLIPSQTDTDPIARLGNGIPNTLAISPNNNILAVGSTIGIYFYDVSTGGFIAPEYFPFACEKVTFSEDGQWIGAVNNVGTVKVFDNLSGNCVATLYPKHQDSENSTRFLCFSPDNRWLATSGGGDINIWELEFTDVNRTQMPKHRRLPGHRRCPIAFSSDSRMFAYVEADEWKHGDPILPAYITVWNVETWTCLTRLVSSEDSVRSICFSPCGQFIAAGGFNRIQVWKIASETLQWTSPVSNAIYKLVTYSSDGTLYAVEVSAGMRILSAYAWDIRQEDMGQEDQYYSFEQSCSEIHPITFDRTCLAFCSGMNFYLWKAESLQLRTFRHLHADGVPEMLRFSQDNQTLAAVYQNEGVVLWNTEVRQDQHPHVFNPVPATTYSIAYDGCFYATNIDGNTIKAWDMNTGGIYAEFTPFDAPWRATTFAPQNNWLAYGGRTGIIYVWNVQQQKMQCTLKGHTSPVFEILFSPDEKYLISKCYHDEDYRLWDIVKAKEIPDFPGEHVYENAVFSPCSSQIIFTTKEDVRVWEILQRDTVVSIRNPLDRIFTCVASTCLHKGNLIASGSWDRDDKGTEQGAVFLWNVHNGEHLTTLLGHTQRVASLAFSPDSTILASGSYDGTILLWDLKPYLRNT